MPGSRWLAARKLGSTGPLCRSVGLRSLVWIVGLMAAGQFLAPTAVPAADIEQLQGKLLAGEYADCIKLASQGIQKGKYGEDWHALKTQAELNLGRYARAKATAQGGLKRYSSSVRLRLLCYRALLHTGETKRAKNLLAEIDRLASRAPWRYTDADDLVALGQTALLTGADARHVLERFFDRAKKYDPAHRAAYISSGRLALAKHDRELAADIYQRALKLFPNDADVHLGLAEAYASSEPARSTAALEKALELNPRHVEALLFRVDRCVDSERYSEANSWIQRVLKVNSKHPQAWAYRAVLAHLSGDPKGETAFRAAALGSWPENPAVDHLIGKKLSQRYRFAEGAAYQRRALELASNYLPARIQLSQDLLRLGEEAEGWRVAAAVHENDGYDVVTFNLLELRDNIGRFRTLESKSFIVRMEAREAAIYGPQVLDLLERAKRTLCKKYGLELKQKVTVEIFPDENDFAVRTFGMPAVSGYLGVCFGNVITANSPASRPGRARNWQAVLWHEFCHVVTLRLSRNRMPRWLSEGISVYEELQVDPAWGQSMNPRYRRMVLDGELTPIGGLSGAFLSPKSPRHLQFAYYESALVVEFLIDRYGREAVKRILRDLGAGLPINTALERHTDNLAKLEREFERFARERAKSLAPEADWHQPNLATLLNDDGDRLRDFVAQNPRNLVALTAYAKSLMEDGQWEQAKAPLSKLLALYPGHTGTDNPYPMLAKVHRELGETAQERRILEKYAALDADALRAYRRLLKLQADAEDWPAVLQTVRRILAVNPLIPQPYRARAQAAENLGEAKTSISAYRALLAMQPEHAAFVHFRLARLLHDREDAAAKRHVLKALEEAPRFREAHRLLLEISSERNVETTRRAETSSESSSEPGAGTAGTVAATGARHKRSRSGLAVKPAVARRPRSEND